MRNEEARFHEATPETDPYGYLRGLLSGKRGVLFERDVEVGVDLTTPDKPKSSPLAIHVFTKPKEIYWIDRHSQLIGGSFPLPTLTGVGEEVMGHEDVSIGVNESSLEEVLQRKRTTNLQKIIRGVTRRRSSKPDAACVKLAQFVQRTAEQSH